MLQSWFGKEASKNLAIAVIILLCGAITVLCNALNDQIIKSELRETQCREEMQQMNARQSERLIALEKDVHKRQLEIEAIMIETLNKHK